MQKPATTPEQQKEYTLNELLITLADNAEGLQQTIKLLQELHESGILPPLQALLQAKEHVVSIAMKQLLRPPVTKMINNAMAAAGALISIEPGTTQKLMSSLSQGLNKAEEGLMNNEFTGVWDMLRVMKDPDVNRAITFGLNVLKGIGQGLQKQDPSTDGVCI